MARSFAVAQIIVVDGIQKVIRFRERELRGRSTKEVINVEVENRAWKINWGKRSEGDVSFVVL